MKEFTMEEIMNYCDQYGFVFQGSGIYGGLANTWDYGPMGVGLKNNIKDAWRRHFIQQRPHSHELDSGILLNPMVWQASGHLDHFSDPMVDCKSCKARHRADALLEELDPALSPDRMTMDEINGWLEVNDPACPGCGARKLTPARRFNLMFETHRGATREGGGAVYLRPENAQGEYINCLNVARSMREKLPFAIGQAGKAFRNEITPKNFIFRTIEFEQMEYQVFCHEEQAEAFYRELKEYALGFYTGLGLSQESLRFHDHESLAHYARAACDIEFRFPFGWGEINGTHDRGDFDLSCHRQASGRELTLFDETLGRHVLPYVVESTCGVERTLLAVLCQALEQEELPGGDTRLVLRISPGLAPVKANVLPLVKKRHQDAAMALAQRLRGRWPVSYDNRGNIGRRYRRGDAVGTPFAITVDDATLEQGTVTLRHRDTMAQETVALAGLEAWLDRRLR